MNFWLKKIKNDDVFKRFFDELDGMCDFSGKVTIIGDTKELYARHPKIRIGIRRALVYLRKTRHSGDKNE